ncbi:MAG: hypothetical protein ABJN14_04985 [Paracoccaceae bacterium]
MLRSIGHFGFMAIALSSSAIAGPWLREEGKGFLSSSSEFHISTDVESSIYAEYGISPNITIGGKIDIEMSPFGIGDQEVLAFVRLPIGPRDKRWLAAYDLGLGYRRGVDANDTIAYLGFTIGRGFSRWGKNGWLVFDASTEQPLGPSNPLYKIDSTVGLSFHEHWKGMFQVFLAASEDDTDITLAPSLIWSPKKAKSSYQIGLEWQEGRVSARLSLWRDF